MSIRTALRPQKISDMIAPPIKLQAIMAAIPTKGLPPAILLAGPSGCGKTTAARLLAGTQAGAEVIEQNVADLRGIEDARELLDRIKVRPLSGSLVVIFNECHQFTKDAQNALLEVVEEPPTWIRFIFATTEPGKLLRTIQNRCARIDFDGLSGDNRVELVRRALGYLGAKLDPVAIATKLAQPEVTAPREILGAVESLALGARVDTIADKPEVFEAVQALYRGQVRETLRILSELKNPDIITFRYVAAAYGKSVLLKAPAPIPLRAVLMLTAPMPYEETLHAAAIVAAVCNMLKA